MKNREGVRNSPELQESCEPVMVFVDGSNLYHALERQFGRHNVDMSALAHKLARRRRLVRTYYFSAPRPKEMGEAIAKEHQRFLDALHKMEGIKVRLGAMAHRGSTWVEKGVDVWLATEMLNFAWRNVYNVAILVSADSDLVPMVEAVQSLGKRVENARVDGSPAWELQKTCDKSIILDGLFLTDCWLSP